MRVESKVIRTGCSNSSILSFKQDELIHQIHSNTTPDSKLELLTAMSCAFIYMPPPNPHETDIFHVDLSWHRLGHEVGWDLGNHGPFPVGLVEGCRGLSNMKHPCAHLKKSPEEGAQSMFSELPTEMPMGKIAVSFEYGKCKYSLNWELAQWSGHGHGKAHSAEVLLVDQHFPWPCTVAQSWSSHIKTTHWPLKMNTFETVIMAEPQLHLHLQSCPTCCSQTNLTNGLRI